MSESSELYLSDSRLLLQIKSIKIEPAAYDDH